MTGWGPLISTYLDPSWRTWLASSLLQMPKEASFHLLTTDTWQWLLLCHNTHHRAKAGQCLNVNGDYMDVWWVTPATHVPCIHQCQNKIFCVRVFVTLFSENFLVYYLFVHFKATFVCFRSHFLWLNHVLKQRNWVFECHEQNEIMCVCVCMCMCVCVCVCASTHRMRLYIN